MRRPSASPFAVVTVSPTPPAPLYALVGNPNCGKTTLFNALTGLRQKVGQLSGRHGGKEGGPRTPSEWPLRGID